MKVNFPIGGMSAYSFCCWAWSYVSFNLEGKSDVATTFCKIEMTWETFFHIVDTGCKDAWEAYKRLPVFCSEFQKHSGDLLICQDYQEAKAYGMFDKLHVLFSALLLIPVLAVNVTGWMVTSHSDISGGAHWAPISVRNIRLSILCVVAVVYAAPYNSQLILEQTQQMKFGVFKGTTAINVLYFQGCLIR